MTSSAAARKERMAASAVLAGVLANVVRFQTAPFLGWRLSTAVLETRQSWVAECIGRNDLSMSIRSAQRQVSYAGLGSEDFKHSILG